ncbi:PHP domain-containing protein, partial [Candidatus Peregrinibacteria bacterium]|nr:PHP domain-containing protein [Candidatus Peregrinibacteria bacterium]
KLPKLVEVTDIRGDFHCHSDFSDGADTMIDMARAAKAAGLEYIAMTDHASPMGMVRGIKKENIGQYLKKIEEARKAVHGIHILAGVEVDILEDGRLYLPDDVLKRLDWVVASVHSHFRQSREVTTKRLLHALENPHVQVLGHPTARMLGEREGIDVDMDAIMKAAAKRVVAMELNASADRLDLPDIYLKRAKELGIKICINADAHSIRGFSYDFGVSQARRGWLEKRDVMNTLPWSAFVKKPGSWKLEAVSSRHGSHSTDGNSYSAHAPEEAP